MLMETVCKCQVITEDCYFDLRGLAGYSSLSVKTLRKHLNNGLAYYKVNGKILVSKGDFDRYIKQFRVVGNLDDIVDKTIKELKI